MSIWFWRSRRLDGMEREVSELRRALTDAEARIGALVEGQAAWADRTVSLTEQIASLDEQTSSLGERSSSLGDYLDGLERRVDELAEAGSRRWQETDRRLGEHATEHRQAVEEVDGPLKALQTDVRRLDARLQMHVEETDRMGAALLDRTGFPRLGDVPARPSR